MKKIYLILFMTALVSYAGTAQHRIGGVRIFPITLEERGDSLYLEMDIHVDGTAMNKCQSWTILPYLTTADSSSVMEMPRALVNGKRKAQLFRRREHFENTYLLSHYPSYKIDKKHGSDTTFTYVFEAPYEFWMDSGYLRIHQILNSCAEQDQWFTLEGLAQVAFTPYIPYDISPRVNYTTPEKITKTLSLSGSAFLDFEAGRSVILPNFRRNPHELAKIDEVLGNVRYDDDFTITELIVTGYASPEGSWESNNRLSLARAEALKNYIRNKFGVEERLIRVRNVAEDWEGLRPLVEQSDIHRKDEILAVIDGPDDPDRKEARLRPTGGPWRQMMNDMFPQLRRVEYEVGFDVKEYSLEEAETIMEKNPEQLNQYELFILGQSYPEESPARAYVTETTVRMFPDDPVANLNAAAALLKRGDADGAKYYLDKAGEIPPAYNNLGVYYLMKEQTDKAAEYFGKALSFAGSPEAHYTAEEVNRNMEELDRKTEDMRIRERYQRR